MIRGEWRNAVLAGVGAVFLAIGPADASTQSEADSLADEQALAHVLPVMTRDLCDDPGPGMMRCFAKQVINPAAPNVGPIPHPEAPSGLGPSDLRSAYGIPSTGGNGKLVAIVDAMDSPSAESDLAAYRTQYGLPACTTANGCFKKVNQNGQQGSYPSADSGWAGEIALDIEMVSAVCPDCKILLVEANTASSADLGKAVNTAVQLGAVAISNSYGGAEDSSTNSDDASYFTHPGVLITASSGDSSYSAGASFPASSPHVLGVGGTTLSKSASSRGWAEKAWKSGGSGCSKYVTKPGFQKDPSCSKRTVADVSAVGDPATGVAVYNQGWQVVGGTSASSPIVAALFTILGLNNVDPSFPYAHTTAFYDVTSGTNGSCGGTYLCTAVAGYDGPTGIGTPNGAVLATLSGNPPPPQDAGAPPPQDSGAPPPHDSGAPPPPQDSGVVADSGSPPSGGEVDSGSSGGGRDSGSSGGPGSSSGDNDAGGGQDNSSSGDSFNTTPQNNGCACTVPGTALSLSDWRLSLGVGVALALAFRRKRAKRKG
jgi:hypothetical protein